MNNTEVRYIIEVAGSLVLVACVFLIPFDYSCVAFPGMNSFEQGCTSMEDKRLIMAWIAGGIIFFLMVFEFTVAFKDRLVMFLIHVISEVFCLLKGKGII